MGLDTRDYLSARRSTKMPVRRPVGVAAIKKEKLAKVRLRSPSGSKYILRHFILSINFVGQICCQTIRIGRIAIFSCT